MFDSKILAMFCEKKEIDAILIIDHFILNFYTLPENRETLEKILYRIKPIMYKHEFHPTQGLMVKGLALAEKEFDADWLSKQKTITPRNKFCKLLIKFLTK